MPLLLIILSILVSTVCAQAPRPLADLDDSSPNLIQPGNWRTHGDSRPIAAGLPLIADNANARPDTGGFVQTLELNQVEPVAIVARASARSTNIGGRADSDHSLYLDIVYQDGTPLWGQQAPFPTGTHDWQTVQVKVFPTKPIKHVMVCLLMRKHSGRAEFRDISLHQANAVANLAWLDGQLVRPTSSNAPATFFRDVASNSGYIPIADAKQHGLSFDLTTDTNALTTLSVTNTNGADRALTLLHVIPVGQSDWRWWSTLSNSVAVQQGQEYVSAIRQPAGNGLLSRFPVAAISAGDVGRAIAIDLRKPIFYRLGYSHGTRELYLAADIALTREKPSATLAFCDLTFPGQHGLRGALAAYSARFPGAFAVRTKRHGLWMPFYPISRVEGPEDFLFAFKEGIDEPQWDDQHDVITFRYTEPMTWWMSMPKDMPRTLDAAIAHAKTLAEQGNRDAATWTTSAMQDADGNIPGRILDTPWCDGIVWSMNSAPGLPAPSHFQTKWNDAIRANPGGQTPGQIDGEYIDSVEGYVTDDLDFRRDHFAAMDTPLVFAPGTHRPAIWKGFIATEYVRRIAADCHEDGKLAMANGTPGTWPWIPTMIDVLGTETNWKHDGKWTPMSIEDMQYRRAMSGGKPYCFLMNTNFDDFTHEDVERYMKRSLAFAFFPGFFSHNAAEKHYFSQPALYNRDRALFTKYLPIIRQLSEAGWRPVPTITTSDPSILIEQFGDHYFTIFNPTSEKRTFTLSLPNSTFINLLTGTPLDSPNLTLNPEDVLPLQFRNPR